MTPEQIAAARSVRMALKKVRDANLRLLTFDGQVYVFPADVDLWPDGDEGNVFETLGAFGEEVSPIGLSADGGAGV